MTGFLGKWRMGNDPTPRPGFDYWAALPGQVNGPVDLDYPMVYIPAPRHLGLYENEFFPRSAILIRYPEMIEAGTVVDGLALSIDLAPTILDFGQAEIGDHIQGRSLVPLLTGG